MKLEISAGVIVYFKPHANFKKQYLILQYLPGHWDFPKGKLEDKESFQQAALRELKEETGLEVKLNEGFEQPLDYIFKDKSQMLVQKKVIYFMGEADTQNITLSHEHIDYKWLEVADALRQLTYENSRQVLRMADLFIEQKLNK